MRISRSNASKQAIAVVLLLLVPTASGIISAATEAEPITLPAQETLHVWAVTGHTVLAHPDLGMGGGVPIAHGPPGAGGGAPAHDENVHGATNTRGMQRECVVWFNGMNVNQRPVTGNFGANRFPSDEARAPAPQPTPDDDESFQDYSFARDVPDCRPYAQQHPGPEGSSGATLGLGTDFAVIAGNAAQQGYAIVTEAGDCDPISEGDNHRFRGRLDFVDPNSIYHEVQEYDYTCPNTALKARGLLGEHTPQVGGGNIISALLRELFPWSGNDVHNTQGCEDPLDEGHKCHGSIADLVTERLWITKTHQPVFDPTLQSLYTHALQVDTCSGFNIYERDGKKALGGTAPYNWHDFEDAHRLPNGTETLYHDLAYHLYFAAGLDMMLGPWPLYDLCTDGSSFSLNDRGRGRVVHTQVPLGFDDIARGSSYDFDRHSDTFMKHRTNCRVQDYDWPMSTYPPGPPPIETDCSPEDHKTVQLTMRTYAPDPGAALFQMFEDRKNGRTGPSVYSGPGIPTGPEAPEPEPVPCPSGSECDEPALPMDTGPVPGTAVTGHTTYVSWNEDVPPPRTWSGLPLEFLSKDDGPPGGAPGVHARGIQRECVTWFNGYNLDQRPANETIAETRFFPGDEHGDGAFQDYSFARDVPTCQPFLQEEPAEAGAHSLATLGLPTDFAGIAGHHPEAAWAIVTERGDCDPITDGANFRYRGNLDFIDPNGIYHEVQEYDYTCPNSAIPGRHLAGNDISLPQHGPLGHILGPHGQTQFPWTWHDPQNTQGCETPAAVPAAEAGHKCNGTLQDIVTERLWITPTHPAVHDLGMDRLYTFALQIDTCAGMNIYERTGKPALGGTAPYGWDDFEAAHFFPDNMSGLYHEIAYHTFYSSELHEVHQHGWPLPDGCTDGSSLSFNDTPRGRIFHGVPPSGVGGNEILQGNAFDFDPSSATWGKHRTNCRVQDWDWPVSTSPPGPYPVSEECHPEDHKTALIQAHAYPHDPDHALLSAFLAQSKGLTGAAEYVGPGASTGPDGNRDTP